MSDATPTPPSRSLFAMSFLLLMFASGLLLVYWAGAVPPSTAASQEATASTHEAASATSNDPPRLPAIQQQLQALENEMTALKTHQATAFEAERQRITEELAKITSAHQRELEQAQEAVKGQEETLAQLKRDYKTLNAQFTDEGILISLADAELKFPKGGAALPSATPAILIKVADFLTRDRHPRLRLQGHTDSLGQATRNLVLSEQRAMAVKGALVALGVAEERIQTEGMGETKPIAENETEQGRSKNRRVDLYLTEP